MAIPSVLQLPAMALACQLRGARYHNDVSLRRSVDSELSSAKRTVGFISPAYARHQKPKAMTLPAWFDFVQAPKASTALPSSY